MEMNEKKEEFTFRFLSAPIKINHKCFIFFFILMNDAQAFNGLQFYIHFDKIVLMNFITHFIFRFVAIQDYKTEPVELFLVV